MKPLPEPRPATMQPESATLEYKRQLTDGFESEAVAFLNNSLGGVLYNKAVHNDYSHEVPPKFEIFPDRLEITSAGGLLPNLSQDEFFSGHSVPRNKELMRIYKDLDLVEHLGSGLPRILLSYPRKYFVFSENFLRSTYPIAGGQVGRQVGGQATEKEGDTGKSNLTKGTHPTGGQTGGQVANLTEKQKHVLSLIQQDPKISRQQLVAKLGINQSAVQKYLETLKSKKIIQRVGKTNGYWKILNDTDNE